MVVELFFLQSTHPYTIQHVATFTVGVSQHQQKQMVLVLCKFQNITNSQIPFLNFCGQTFIVPKHVLNISINVWVLTTHNRGLLLKFAASSPTAEFKRYN